MKKRLQPLRAVGNKDWGCRNEDLRALYMGYIKSVADYAAAGWQTLTCESNIRKLDRVQNEAARIITGCNKSTPIEGLLHEANLVSFSKTKDEKAAIAYQKYIRNPDAPNYNQARHYVRPKNSRDKQSRNWRIKATQISNEAGLENTIPASSKIAQKVKPWDHKPNVKFLTQLREPCNKAESPDELNRKTKDTLDYHETDRKDIIVWTDGSVLEEQTKGGSGAIVETNQGKVELTEPAGKYCTSFHAEMVAIKIAIEYIKNNNTDKNSIIILTDSKSAIEELQKGPMRQSTEEGNRTWQNIYNINAEELTFQWIPSHVGTEGNEAVDKLAKRATDLDQEHVPINFSIAKNRIKKLTRDMQKTISHDHYKQWHTTRKTHEEIRMTRRERVVLAQIRTGHSSLTASYRHRIGIDDNQNCEHCGEEETVDHLIRNCPRWTTQRTRNFGSPYPEHADITSNGLIDYLRDIGKLANRM